MRILYLIIVFTNFDKHYIIIKMMRLIEFVKCRPAFCVCAAAAISVFACSFFDIAAAAVTAGCMCFAALFLIPFKSRLKRIAACALLLSAVSTAVFYIYFRVNCGKAEKFSDTEAEMLCTAISESTRTSGGYYCVNAVCKDEKTNNGAITAKVYYNEASEFVPSEKFSAVLSFAKAEDIDKFDSEGVHISAFAVDVKKISGPSPADARYICCRLRRTVSGLISYNDGDTAAFVRAMILGDKSDISPKFSMRFSYVGMSHVMAVSGMHLVFAVLFFDFLFVLVGIGYRPRCVLAFAVMLAFVAVSGFAVSCIRAAIMMSVLYLGKLFDRFSDSLTSLSEAALIILIAAPYNVRNISFLLSVSAVFGLVVLYPRLIKILPVSASGSFLYKVISLFTASVSANIACLPVIAFSFGRVSLLAPISNVIMITAVQIMFYLGFAGMALSFVPGCSGVIGSIQHLIYRLIRAVTDFEYGLKYSSVNSHDFGFYFAVFLLLILVAGVIVIKSKDSKRRVYPFVAAYAVICTVLVSVNVLRGYGIVKAEFVDVGMGSCTVFSGGEQAVIIDCGGDNSKQLYRSLMFSDVKRIQLLALTHFDADHVKYLDYIVSSYDIERIIYPKFCDDPDVLKIIDRARKDGCDIEPLTSDAEYEVLGGAKLYALVEKATKSKYTHNTSALYKVEYGQSSVICCGDMDVHEEYAYLDYGDLLNCDILLAAHHGSDTSSSTGILKMYSPEYAVISVGRDNKYSLPGKKALKRLENASKVLRTDEMSTITFNMSRKGYRLVN